MSHVLRIAVVDPNDKTRESLKNLLLGMDQVWLEAECSRFEFFLDVVSQTKPDIGVVALDSNVEKALKLVEEVRRQNPDVAIVVVSSATDGQVILRAMRAGAREFVPAPVKTEDLVTALEHVSSQKLGASGGKSRSCTVIAVAGSMGGVGATSIAVNLGAILAKDPANSAALIDLDLALGDADVFLDAIPDYTLVDVAQNVSRLDFTLLKRSLTKHSSGLYLLPRPVRLQDTALITPTDLARVFGLLKATFSHLILDLSKSYTDVDLAALKAANQILLVTQLDLPCLRNVVRLMMSFEEEEGLKEKVRIVVNRAGLDSGQISLKKAQETIGGEIFWQIPNDYRVMSEMRNNGTPLIVSAPKAGVTQSLIAMAQELSASGASDDKADGKDAKNAAGKKGGGWFDRLLPTKKA